MTAPTSTAAPVLIWYAHASRALPCLEVAGLSLAKRAVLSAQAAGFERLVLSVHAEDEAAVRQELEADRRVQAIVEVVVEASPAALAGTLGQGAAGELVFIRGDGVWSTSAIRAMAAPLPEGCDERRLVSPEGAVAGLFRVRAGAVEVARLLEDDVEDDAADVRVQRHDHRREWHRVAGAGDGRDAETVLLASLTKPSDGVISRNLNRKISTFISRRLARREVSPNHVTAVVFLLGVASGPLAYTGRYAGFVLAGFCYWFSAVLDGCDGELSRLKYLGTRLGAWLDTITDDVVCLSFIAGTYLALARDAAHPYWTWVGAIGTTFYLLTILPR